MALVSIGGARRGTHCSDVRRKYGTCNDHRTPQLAHCVKARDPEMRIAPPIVAQLEAQLDCGPAKGGKRVSAVQAHIGVH